MIGELAPSEHGLLFPIGDEVGKVRLDHERVTVDEAGRSRRPSRGAALR